jgi:hypothetical protein
MKGHAYYRKKAGECRALIRSARSAPGVQDVLLISALEELAKAFEEEAAAAERRERGGSEGPLGKKEGPCRSTAQV